MSIALIAPEISAKKAFSGPTFSAKSRRKLALLFLKIPPHDEVREFEEPSELHFIQLVQVCHLLQNQIYVLLIK